jgi:UDP-N-acetylmuramoylalanine--D-glutamate ligase
MKPTVPEWLLHLLRRPAAVFGQGVSGRAAAGLLGALGAEVAVYDRAAARPEHRSFGSDEARRHGLVVVSPGFAAGHEWLRAARAAECEILGELDLGALAWPGEIAAVTGTNGKTTLTEFLAHALRRAGRDARAVGNIGDAFCDAWRRPATRSSIAVCEVSSFQAEIMSRFEASACLWTNFAEDHLERHGSLEAYFRAKLQLVRRSLGRNVFLGPAVADYARRFGQDLPAGALVPFESQEIEAAVAGSVFGRLPQRENYLLARALWRALDLPAPVLAEAAASFRLGPHRLARVGEVRGVAFWNDSKATNFHAVEAALAGFERPVLWIGGGRAKGGDIPAFVARIAPRVQRAFVIGETRDALAGALRSHGVPVAVCETLRESVERALSEAASGDTVLLGPAFASFDMFRGYDDRGRCFESIVAELAAERRERPAVSRRLTPSSANARQP